MKILKEISKRFKNTGIGILKGVTTRRKRAFTMAEVLIVLGIVGIVASVTIPNWVAKYQKQVFVTRLQKVYSDLGNAMRMGQVEYGDPDTWDWSLSSSDFFQTYLSTFKRVSIKPFSENRKVVTYYSISGKQASQLSLMGDAQNHDVVTLANGAQLFLMNNKSSFYNPNPNSTYIGIYIDVNGLAKPNTFGKDVFLVLLLRDGSVIFHQRDDGEPSLTTRRTPEQLKNGPSIYNYQCNKQGKGVWCGALIQQSGWKIPDDYPWK